MTLFSRVERERIQLVKQLILRVPNINRHTILLWSNI